MLFFCKVKAELGRKNRLQKYNNLVSATANLAAYKITAKNRIRRYLLRKILINNKYVRRHGAQVLAGAE
jgi:hypothetical protein